MAASKKPNPFAKSAAKKAGMEDEKKGGKKMMKKPGAKGAPKASDFKKSEKTAKKPMKKGAKK